MLIRVLLFARIKEMFASSSLEIELPEGATVGELRQVLIDRTPHLKPLLDRCRIAVDSEFAIDLLPIQPHNEIALIPPVSGGSSFH
ncbi:MAG: molybdopterin converting factor subunit 1 [Gemmataceae bacterium]